MFANTDWYLYNFRLSLAEALRASGCELVLVSPPGKYAQRLQEMGFHWVEFEMSRRGMNPLVELNSLFRLTRLYRSEKPDIVHHFTVKCVLYGSLAAQMAGVKGIINAITGLGYVFIGRGWRAFFLRALVRLLYHFALGGTHVIFQNIEDREMFLHLKLVSPRQVHLIQGSGVDMQRYSPDGIAPELVLVVLPARLLWDKGVGEFVEAAKLLKAKGVAARFALVGDKDVNNPAGVAETFLLKWRELGVVEWWGWQEDMVNVYRQAHIVCLPSYREGLPRTLVEAAACGRPLVAADVPGCRSIVRQGENGFLVPPRDGAALAIALERLILDGAMRCKMGLRSREIAMADFSVEQITDETLQVYRQAGLSGVEQ
jgi:glycosyltransferase involved in cell wall biosynthesis